MRARPGPVIIDTHNMNDAAKGTTGPTRPGYRIEDLTIDVGTAQVHRHGQLVPLPRLSFDLLLALVRSAPNLVTVDELMEMVWAGVVVNAETVSQRVKLLRVALDDDARRPRYLAVVRGRGYRIVAPVTAIDIADRTDDSSPAAAPHTRSDRRSPWRWSVIAAVALVAASTVFLLRQNSPPETPAPIPAPVRSVAVLPFDNLGQSPQDAALAFGVAETLLHRLSASKELTVIARQSSFSFSPRGTDVREIGRRLNARYLIEGSLQSTPTRLRITAQLIDTTTGGHVWSLQFDRKPEDIFVIQDEIAARVTEALRLSMAESLPAKDSGTQDFDAYLAHAQGRARLATTRMSDAKLAVGDFERAIQIDPKFARAYAGLAEARYFVADGEMSRERGANLKKAVADSLELLERALEIDERDADTHLQIASILWGGPRAEQELMRALELNPNSAAGFQTLAFIRMFRDRKPDEAVAAIDKARLLSPLQVQFDNDKAQIVLWGKSDVKLAEQLLLSVLERDPTSSQALWRLGELYWCCSGQSARGIKYLEQALQRDPDNEFGRRIMMKAYLDLGDADEAQALASSAAHPVEVRLVPLLVYHGEWRSAAEVIYLENSLGTSQAIEGDLRALAIRMNARITGNYAPAREYLTGWSYVTWDEKGIPTVPTTWVGDYAVGLADVMIQAGERERARRLLDATLKSIDDEANYRKRGDRWYLRSLSMAYALLERDDESLGALEKAVALGQLPAFRLHLDNEPTFQRLRSQPRFRAIVEQIRRITVTQRQQLDQMRAAGLVPHRSKK